MERFIHNELDNNDLWYANAEVEAALLTASFGERIRESFTIIQAKRAERAQRAGVFVYPQIRKPDNHRRRYRQARREAYEREKHGIKARWMLV